MSDSLDDSRIPLGELYAIARRAEKFRIVRRGVLNAALLAFALAAGSWAHPVGDIWDVHQALLGSFHIQKQNHHETLLMGAQSVLPFEDVTSTSDAWDWLNQSLWPLLFPSAADTGTSTRDGRASSLASWYSQPVGAVRLRQMRVRPRHCHGFNFSVCWPEFADDVQSSELLSERRPWRDAPAINDTFATGLPALVNEGRTGSSYGSSAQVLDVPLSCRTRPGAGDVVQALSHAGADCTQLLTILRRYDWLDEATRALSVEMSIRNANYDLWTALRFHFDFSASGRVHPSFHLSSLRFRQYSPVEGLRVAVEVVFMGLLFFSLLHEGVCTWRVGLLRYLVAVPQLLQWLFLIILVISTICYNIFLSDVSAHGPELEDIFSDAFLGTPVLILTRSLDVAITAASIGVCLGFLLLIDLVRLSEATHVFFIAVRAAAAEVLPIFFYLMFGLLGIALACHFAFASQLPVFRSFGVSLGSLLRAFTRDLVFANPGPSMAEAQRLLLAFFIASGGCLLAICLALLAGALVEARRKARRRNHLLVNWSLRGRSSDPTKLKQAGEVVRVLDAASENALWLAAAGWHEGCCLGILRSIASKAVNPLDEGQKASKMAWVNPFPSRLNCLLASLDSISLAAHIDLAADFAETSPSTADGLPPQPTIGREELVALLGGWSAEVLAMALLSKSGQPSIRVCSSLSGTPAAEVGPRSEAVVEQSALEPGAQPPKQAVGHEAVGNAMFSMLQLSGEVQKITERLRCVALDSDKQKSSAKPALITSEYFEDEPSEDIGALYRAGDVDFEY